MDRRVRLHTNEAAWSSSDKHTHRVQSLLVFDPFKLLISIVINSVSLAAEMKVLSTVLDVSRHFLAVREQRKP